MKFYLDSQSLGADYRQRYSSRDGTWNRKNYSQKFW